MSEKLSKTIHPVGSATQEEIAMLRGLGYTVIEVEVDAHHKGYTFIEANVNGNRFYSLRTKGEVR